MLGVHYPSDVVGGLLVGALCGVALTPLLELDGGEVDHENDVTEQAARAPAAKEPPIPPVDRGDVQPCRRPGRLVVPALCAVLLGVGPETDAPHAITTIRLAASTPTQVPPGQPGPEGGPTEDLVPVPLGRLHVWPSGIGLLVTRPTSTATVVRVRTTVLNESPAPYDVYAVQGPTARYDGRDLPRIADSRFVQPAPEHVVQPGRSTAFETTLPAGPGRLTLQYRADFRYVAVVVDGSGPS